jgi:hypothetical protein
MQGTQLGGDERRRGGKINEMRGIKKGKEEPWCAHAVMQRLLANVFTPIQSLSKGDSEVTH